jgi:hypothetical protein
MIIITCAGCSKYRQPFLIISFVCVCVCEEQRELLLTLRQEQFGGVWEQNAEKNVWTW